MENFVSSTLSVQTRWGTVRVEVTDDGSVTVHNALSVDAIYPCKMHTGGYLGFHIRSGDLQKLPAICVRSWARRNEGLEITVKPDRVGEDKRFVWRLGHPVTLQVSGARAKTPDLRSFLHISALCFPTGQNAESVDLLREQLFPLEQDF